MHRRARAARLHCVAKSSTISSQHDPHPTNHAFHTYRETMHDSNAQVRRLQEHRGADGVQICPGAARVRRLPAQQRLRPSLLMTSTQVLAVGPWPCAPTDFTRLSATSLQSPRARTLSMKLTGYARYRCSKTPPSPPPPKPPRPPRPKPNILGEAMPLMALLLAESSSVSRADYVASAMHSSQHTHAFS